MKRATRNHQRADEAAAPLPLPRCAPRPVNPGRAAASRKPGRKDKAQATRFGAFDLLSSNIAVVNSGGRILFVNSAWVEFARVNGHPTPEGFVGTDYFAACAKADAEPKKPAAEPEDGSAEAGIRAVLSGRTSEFSIEYPCHTSSEERWFRLSATPAETSDGPSAIIAHVDITERKRSEDEAWQKANHDALTGLPNRSLAMDRLRQAILRSERDQTSGALLFVDLDNFKPINDVYGHETGDRVLREISHRMRAVVREGDTVARLAGDEFLVLAPTAIDRKGARSLAAKIAAVIGQPVLLGDNQICCSASVGLALFPEDGGDADAVVHAADCDMYREKNARKNGASTRGSASSLPNTGRRPRA